MTLHRIVMAGVGGQGILFIGKLLANAAVQEVAHITFIPAYGAEVRGGPSSCQITLSDTEISSPVAERFDAMVLMHQDGVDRYLPQIARGGLAVINGSLSQIESASNRLIVPATERAEALGDGRGAGMLMLGVLLKARPLVTPACVEATLRQMSGRKAAVLDSNLAAFRAGLES